MLRSKGKRRKAQAFWDWFSGAAEQLARDHDAVVAGKAGPEPLIEPVAKRLNAYHKGLAHEIGQDADGVYDLVISANGIKDRIDAVTALVRAAPDIDGWKVTAFRPRKAGGDFLLRMGGEEFHAENVFYRLGETSGGLCDIEILFGAGFDAPDGALIGPAFLIMDSVIGEYDVMTKIGQVAARTVKPADDMRDYAPIAALADDLDARFPERAN